MAEIVRKRSRLAVTMMEICIVGVLSSVILGVGFAMMTRSNRQFKKGNDMINIQSLMDNIVERIRTDIRSLKRVNVADSENESSGSNIFDFYIIRNVEDTNDDDENLDAPTGNSSNEIHVVYEFDPEEKTLIRYEGDNKKYDFHGANQVISLVFTPQFETTGDKRFKCLDVAMQIASNDYSGKKDDQSTLSIACQFYSTCVESDLRIPRNN